MSNVYIRFGSEPSATQEVAPDLKERGINLLRKEPSDIKVQGGATTIQPNFAIYQKYLPSFMKAAMKKTYVKTGSSIFAGIHVGANPSILPISFPDLVVAWQVPIAEEVRDEMRGKGWRDTMAKGKPAMVKTNPTSDDAKYALSKSVIQTNPSGENSMNISQFRQALILSNILAVFLKTHQYPAFVDDDHESEFNKQFADKKAPMIQDDEMADNEVESDDEDDTKFTQEEKVFRVNLPEDVDTRALFYDEHSMPESAGLLFQYIEELAKFDRTTVLETVHQYFYGCLSEDEEDAAEAFEQLKRAMGSLHNSEWGNKMAHLFKCVGIAMKCQASMNVMMTAGRYDGVQICGGGFRVTINGREYSSASKADIKAALPNLDYHANALWEILKKLKFLTEDDRLAAFRTTKSMKKLKEYIDALPLEGGALIQDFVSKQAKFLSFPEDRVLDPSANSIAFALSFIAEPTKDLGLLPSMHHSVLFSHNRAHIAWSAFGEEVPSFRVPGGKAMSLTSSFRVTSAKLKAEKGPMAHRDVTKIGAHMVALQQGLDHLDKTISDKTVLNPFGNAIVNAATSHMNKMYEGASCQLIVEALRSAAKVTVIDSGSGARGGKRGRDEDDAASSRKKTRLDVGF